MLSEIHAETEPHKTRTSLGWDLNSTSQAVLRSPGKSGAAPPIQEISSRRTTVRFESSIARSSQKNASFQFRNGRIGELVRRASVAICSSFVAGRSASGASPSNSKNASAVRRANSRNSVDLPIRRRPRHATMEDVRFFHSDSRSRSSSLRPTNMGTSSWAATAAILPRAAGQVKRGICRC